MIRIFNHYVPAKILLLALTEALLIGLSIYGGALIRFFEPERFFPASTEPLLPKAATFAALMVVVMAVAGLYQTEFREDLRAIWIRLVAAFGVGFGLMSLLFYLIPELYLGRGAFGIAFVLAAAAVVVVRLAFFRWTRLGMFQPRILVLGTGTRAVNVDTVAQRNLAGSPLNVVGFLPLAMPMATIQHHVQPSRILPAEESILHAVEKHRINEIVIAVRERRGGGLPVKDLLDCRLRGVKVTELSTFFERERGQIRLDSISASWMVFGDGFRQNVIREMVKGAFDITASTILLVLTSPLMLVTALCIVLEDGRPVLYRQERVGEGGRPFTILKFRSMRADAEQDGKPRWAAAGDDRTTRVGRIIRKLRIDELPQVFNVFKGDMSFVGPRPERPYFVEKLSAQIPYYAARHSVKPGITGWAQVRYAYGASFEDAVEKLQYDLYYVKNHTLFLDLMILLDTVRVVLFGKGAR